MANRVKKPAKKPTSTLGVMCRKYQLKLTPSMRISSMPAMVPVESIDPPKAVA